MSLSNNTSESQKICEGCGGWCCKYYIAMAQKDKPDVVEYWDQRSTGRRVEKYGSYHYEVYQPCKHLNEDNKCNIYENRPATCRKFPSGATVDWIDFCPLAKKLVEQHKKKIPKKTGVFRALDI